MNLENLRKLFNESNENLVIKNYKELCKVLEIGVKEGNSKKSDIKEFKRHFKFKQNGHKFIVEEIYDMTLDKIDGRGINGKYSDDIQNLMISLMHQSDKEELFLSSNVLLKKLNMINKNYALARRNVPKLSELIEVDEDIIYDFYNTTNNSLVTALETALKRLRSRRLIIWEKVIGVAKVTHSTNEYGEVQINIEDNTKDKASIDTSLEYRVATFEEKQIILEIEKNVLREMGYKDTQSVFLNGLWRTYKRRVTKRVRQQLNIKYHFDAYAITFVSDNIEEEYNNMKDNTYYSSYNNINKNVYNSIKDNAITKHNNSKAKEDNSKAKLSEVEDILQLYSDNEVKNINEKVVLKAYDKVRVKENFVQNTITIADNVILANAKDLSSELKKEVVKHTKVEETFNEELPF